jgi:hypothetical protein
MDVGEGRHHGHGRLGSTRRIRRAKSPETRDANAGQTCLPAVRELISPLWTPPALARLNAGGDIQGGGVRKISREWGICSLGMPFDFDADRDHLSNRAPDPPPRLLSGCSGNRMQSPSDRWQRIAATSGAAGSVWPTMDSWRLDHLDRHIKIRFGFRSDLQSPAVGWMKMPSTETLYHFEKWREGALAPTLALEIIRDICF